MVTEHGAWSARALALAAYLLLNGLAGAIIEEQYFHGWPVLQRPVPLVPTQPLRSAGRRRVTRRSRRGLCW